VICALPGAALAIGAADVVAAHSMRSRSAAQKETTQLSAAIVYSPSMALQPFVVLGAERHITDCGIYSVKAQKMAAFCVGLIRCGISDIFGGCS
jgi:hypothetical protein